jgi:hypothetical protein
MRCTYQVELLPTPDQHELLRATMDRFSAACQFVKVHAESVGEYSQSKLQQQLYMRLRQEFQLGAQVAVLAIKEVADTYRYAGSLPEFTNFPCMTYDQRTCRFINEVVVSLWTIQGRRLIPYRPINDKSTKKDEGERITTTDLNNGQGRLTTESPDITLGTTSSSGIDDIAQLIPFACEEIELCSENGKLLLNMVYSRHVLCHFARTRKGNDNPSTPR